MSHAAPAPSQHVLLRALALRQVTIPKMGLLICLCDLLTHGRRHTYIHIYSVCAAIGNRIEEAAAALTFGPYYGHGGRGRHTAVFAIKTAGGRDGKLQPSCLSEGCWWSEIAPSSGAATHGVELAGGGDGPTQLQRTGRAGAPACGAAALLKTASLEHMVFDYCSTLESQRSVEPTIRVCSLGSRDP